MILINWVGYFRNFHQSLVLSTLNFYRRRDAFLSKKKAFFFKKKGGGSVEFMEGQLPTPTSF